MKATKLHNSKMKQLEKEETEKINEKLLAYLDLKLSHRKKKVTNKDSKEESKDVEMQENLDSTDEEDTKDTNSLNQLSQKNKLLSFEDRELEDLTIMWKFMHKANIIQNFIKIQWRKVWTVDVLNWILVHIFDYRLIKDLNNQERFLKWVQHMFQIVRLLSLFLRISLNEIFKYWCEDVKKKISEIYVLKYQLVRSSYDIIFDKDFYFQEIFTNCIPDLLQNSDIKNKFEEFLKEDDQQSDNDINKKMQNYEANRKESIPAIYIKKNLHLFYSAVIVKDDMTDSQKSTMMKDVLLMLGFQIDKFDVFSKSISENRDFFLINVLYSLFRMLGIDREYYFEHLLERYNNIGIFYNLKQYTLSFLKISKIDAEDKKYVKFMKSIGFINSVLCNNLGEQFSLDIKLCWIEMMGKMFPEFYGDWRTLEDKQDFFIRIHKFYQIVNSNWQKSLFFSEGLNQYFLSNLKYSLCNEYLVEINLNTLTDAFELSMFENWLEKVLWFIVMSVLKYPTNKTIIEKNNKILKFYFSNEEKKISNEVIYSWQFLLIKTIRTISEFKDVIKIIEDTLYSNEETAEKSIIELSNSLNKEYNWDHKLHNLKYLNQLIEKNDWINPLAKEAIQKEDVLKIVYENVMKLKSNLNNDIEDIHLLSLWWAKFIAAIGIGKPFVSEGNIHKQRKANKFIFNELSEEEDSKKDTKYLEWDENACDFKEEIIVNREDAIIMGTRVHRRLLEFIKTTSNPLKPYFYSRWRLEYEILNLIKGVNTATLDHISNDLSLFKIDENNRMDIYRLLRKFTDESIDEIDGNPSYYKDSLGKFWVNLVNHMNSKEFKSIFSSLSWLLKNEDVFILNLLMPYILYFSVRFSDHTSSLIEQVSSYFNEVLEEGKESHVSIIFSWIDFLHVCLIQDKVSFKKYIDQETKFKYVDKFFQIDPARNKDSGNNIKSFIEKINESKTIERSFYFVKKAKALMSKISKIKKMKAAKRIKQYKRYTLYFEEEVRYKIARDTSMKGTFETDGFFEILGEDDVIDIVEVYKKLLPEDFDNKLFDSILDHWGGQKIGSQDYSQESSMKQNYLNDMSSNESTFSQNSFCSQNEHYTQFFSEEKPQSTIKQKKLLEAYDLPHFWKNNNPQNWEFLAAYHNKLNVGELKMNLSMIELNLKDSKKLFENLITVILTELYKVFKKYLNSPNMTANFYKRTVNNLKMFLFNVYKSIMQPLSYSEGEIAYFFKLYLHVIYEIEAVLVTVGRIISENSSEIEDVITSSKRRTWEQIFNDLDLEKYMHQLNEFFEERTNLISENSFDTLDLIFSVRKALFDLLGRKDDYASYCLRLARLYRKCNKDYLIMVQLFKTAKEYKNMLIGFEIEHAKYTNHVKNSNEAFMYLDKELSLIKEKEKKLKSKKGVFIIRNWENAYEKAQMYWLKLLISIDRSDAQIDKRFNELTKQVKGMNMETPHFMYAKFLDDQISETNIEENKNSSANAKAITSRIVNYLYSVKYGQKFLWQSLPRTLELWFELFNDAYEHLDTISKKIYEFDSFKLAQVLQILLSRFRNKSSRAWVAKIVSKLASEYPSQMCWWVLHFKYFYFTTAQQKQNPPELKQDDDDRKDFATQVLERVKHQNEGSYNIIKNAELLFKRIIRISEQTEKSKTGKFLLPSQLAKEEFAQYKIAMPIVENMIPRLPKGSYDNKDNTKKFSVYNPNPVYIARFYPEAQIMMSKEKPKKIGLVGTDGNVYFFLLKCDQLGDLRKEARFIEYSNLVNKILEQDFEWVKRNLKLSTFWIIPLTKNIGLIEWIDQTSTLKSIVSEYWRKNAIKSEMSDIKQEAINSKQGDNHSWIWDKVKSNSPPVLNDWFMDRFPIPNSFFDSRLRFIRATAAWSIAGYIIGLGDRHGDNILIHLSSGNITHVDFDWIFEKGTKLKVPEKVPFRLTKNIIDAFGLFKEKGPYVKSWEVILKALRDNSKNVEGYLHSFIHDPLIESRNNIKINIKQAIEQVKKKLSGQIDHNFGSITIQEQVEKIILQALNDEYHRLMYIGWMPWL